MKKDYLKIMREGGELNLSALLKMTVQLSIPTVLAQISFIVMEYFDAAMVGRLGGNATAAIGLVSSTTWLFGGLLSSVCIGFTVQTSQYIGAGDNKSARRVMKQGIVTALLFSLLFSVIGVCIHAALPVWLGGDEAIVSDAAEYFLIFALFLPFQQFNNICAGMLQSSGNMRTPGILEALMCLLNIGFNYIFIYVFNMGVTGAAIGTALSELTIAVPMGFFLLLRSPLLGIVKGEGFAFDGAEMKRAFRIGFPVALEQTVMTSAYIMSTRIITPLGSVSVAAHSLAVTAEGLCYMPGYGIGAAATTMIGQSIGAKRSDLTKRLGRITVYFGMAVMSAAGLIMFFAAELVLKFLSPVEEIYTLGAQSLRLEVFAEPMFAASIVAMGVFRGAGDTFVPSIMNLVSMWFVRIPLSALLASRYGLKGVWVAMAIELCFRGTIFLIRLFRKTGKKNGYTEKPELVDG